MRIAVYPGSFDPVTLGHVSVIRRAAGLFDRVLVCAMRNSEKHYMFSPEERVELLRRVLKDIPNVEVEACSGLLSDYCREKGAAVIIKGLRSVADFSSEQQMAWINRSLNPGTETLFLPAEEQHLHISSTAVRELANYGVNLTGWVPDEIVNDVMEKTERGRERHGEWDH